METVEQITSEQIIREGEGKRSNIVSVRMGERGYDEKRATSE